jgi:hypothetical protein
MASAIEDVSSLPGETIRDQEGMRIGKVKEVYGIGGDEAPMWVTVEASTGVGESRILFVPIARLKQEHDQVRVPYSFQHLQSSPEIEPGKELSEQDERALRDYYAIDLADQELRTDNESYASRVPDKEGQAEPIDVSESSEGQSDGESEGQSDRESEGQSEGQSDRESEGQSDRESEGESDRESEGQSEGES